MKAPANPEHAIRDLAAAPVQPPFGFEEFERRRASGERRRRAGAWGATTAIVLLAAVGLLAWMMEPPRSAAVVATHVPEARVEHVYAQPALVNLAQFDVTSELEDHIALLDAQISAARVYAAPAEQLRALERTRAQLNDSLQRVSYAQNLLNF
jgi:hypothetical protein